MKKRLFYKYKLLVFFLMCFTFLTKSSAQGYQISGELTNFDGRVLYLAMLYGDNQYIVDSASNSNGKFVFDGELSLKSGIYVAIVPPSKTFFILIDEDEAKFSFKADLADVEHTIQFEGSEDNQRYYDYLNFFEERKKTMDRIKSEYDGHQSEPDRLELLANMQELKQEVVNYQKRLVESSPNSLTSAIVKCELTLEVPAFEGKPEEIQLKQYLYFKQHYFDNIDLADERLIRAPKNLLVSSVETYLDQTTFQHPDSIIASIDLILTKCEPAMATYQYFLTTFFNKYRTSKSVGMDAVYAHIARNYIAAGKTPWIDEEQKSIILSAVEAIEPTLIGKTAPDFEVQMKNGDHIALHQIEANYTVLFFWSPNCAHCQRSMPLLNKFQIDNATKGVKVFAVCTKVNESEKECWEYLDKMKLYNWINASDQKGGQSRFHKTYNVKNTPSIFVLDKNKKILVKNISVEQLEEVMNRLSK